MSYLLVWSFKSSELELQKQLPTGANGGSCNRGGCCTIGREAGVGKAIYKNCRLEFQNPKAQLELRHRPYIYIESASNPMRDLGMLHAAEAALIFLISAVWKEVLLRNPKENATLRSLRSVCLDCLRPAWSHVLHPRFTKTVDRLCSRLKRSQGYSWRLPSSGQISKSWRLIRCLLLSHLQHARKRAMNNSGGSVIPTLVGWDFGNLRLRLCDLANH